MYMYMPRMLQVRIQDQDVLFTSEFQWGNMDEVKSLHILTEIFKFSFAMQTMLADPDFVPNVHQANSPLHITY